MTDEQRLIELTKTLQVQIRKAFLSAIQGITDKALIDQLIKYIQAGDIQGAFDSLGFSPAALRPITAMIEQAYENGGVFTASTFPAYINTPMGQIVFHFDVKNPRAEQWIKHESSTLIQQITDDAKSNVRDIMTSGLIVGNNPKTTALDIVGRIDPSTGNRTGGVLGLTTNQEAWVRSARNKLLTLDPAYLDMELRDKRFDGIVNKAIASDTPLPSDTVDKLIIRYRANALRYRGEMIARTETHQSLMNSDYEAVQQAVDTGAIKHVQLEWDGIGDLRERDSHFAMNGSRVQFGMPFILPTGSRMRFPGDTSMGAAAKDIINCRCRAHKAIDWFAGVK